jgi:hypothetical protein
MITGTSGNLKINTKTKKKPGILISGFFFYEILHLILKNQRSPRWFLRKNEPKNSVFVIFAKYKKFILWTDRTLPPEN